MMAVILAGGQGTRLWPMSRKVKPKQFFEILGDEPMIVEVYKRLKLRLQPEDIFVSTQKELAKMVNELLQDLPEENILIEPQKRDTAPAKAFVVNELNKRGRGDESVAFIPTDHFIANPERFLNALMVADELIQETGKMLDIAVVPAFPSTSLGYTKIGKRVLEKNDVEVYSFEGHKEKPDYQQAKSYIESGDYLWHANYYMWTPKLFLEAFKEYAPEIYEKIQLMNNTEVEQEKEKLFGKMPKISVDYAITEKMDPSQVFIIRGDFGWSDIGAWNVLYDRLKQDDSESNVIKGKVINEDSRNNLIYGSGKKLIATIGVHDMIVVETEDALLICPQGRSEDVKKLIQKLEEEGYQDYL